MANMKIKTEKILSPSNIKRIIMLGISIRDQLSNMEKGLISEYQPTETYTNGMSCYYNDYLYKCLYTTTGTWDSTKWQKIGDELDLITKQDIETMLGLTQEEIASLQSLISTEIRLDKVFSSSDTYNRLLTVENECKKFTLEQLAKKAGVVYKIVADTTGVDSTEFLYLISNGSNGYNIYAYIDGSAVKISDTNINLDDYAKLSDLDDFVKKTDADGKYATITTVDGKVDKTSILSTISSNPSDDKLLSEKAIKSELDNLKTNFEDGVNTIYDSVVAKGVTPTDKSPSSIVEALDKTFNNSILIKEYSSDGLKTFDNRGVIKEGGYYKDEKYKICYVNVIYLPKVDLSSDGDGCLLLLSGLPMPLIRNNWSNPTFLSIENIDNPNRQCKAGYGIDEDGINGCIFMTPFNKNERVRIYGAYQYSES